MWSYGSQLELMLMIVRRLKWPLIAIFYDILIYWKPIPSLLALAGLMVLAYQAYQMDLVREREAADDFNGDGLFYRYGLKASWGVWPIPVKPEWDVTEVESFAVDLRRKLAAKIRLRLPADSVDVREPLSIADKQRAVRKEFVSTFARTRVGSMVTHFIHIAPYGRSITLRYDSFVRGVYQWYDVIKFIAESPLTIWFWSFGWWRNRYSIVNRLCNFSSNSYDNMDIATIFTTTHHLVLDEIRSLLEEEGVLTPELKQMIQQQITNVQNFNVSGSSGVTIGAASQSTTVSSPKAA